MKRYKVSWTHEAVLDLEEITDYIAQDRLSPAISLYKAVKKKCSSLTKSPLRHRIVPELLEIGITNYREIIHKAYRIVYKLTSRDIFIIAVVDSRRDFETFIYHRLVRK